MTSIRDIPLQSRAFLEGNKGLSEIFLDSSGIGIRQSYGGGQVMGYPDRVLEMGADTILGFGKWVVHTSSDSGKGGQVLFYGLWKGCKDFSGF